MAHAVAAPAYTGSYVSANGLHVYYEEYGQGEPLILLHGGTLSSQMWQAQIPTFSAHFRVLIPDSRGHGRTDNPSGTFSYRLLADDLAAFVAALGLERPLIYGYSDGGHSALELGMRYPEVAQALVVGAAGFRIPDSARAAHAAMFGDAEDLDLAQLEERQPEYVAMLRRLHGSGSDDTAWQTLLRQITPMWLTPLNYGAEDFGRIRVPTLVITGDRDEFVPVTDATELYQLITSAELAIIPNANHRQFAGSELFTNAGLDFLLRHAASRSGATSI